MAGKTEEEKFLALERFHIRLGQAENADQLSTFCIKHLPMLLTMLEGSVNSNDSPSRDKILEILAQLKRRLRANPESQLPVDFLLEQYKKNVSALIRNFSFLFLKIGFTRLEISSQIEYAPQLLEAMVNKTYDQQVRIWLQLLPVISARYGEKRRSDDPSPRLFDFTSPCFPAQFVSKMLDFLAQFLLLTEFDFGPRNRQRQRLASNAPAGAGEPAEPRPPRGVVAMNDDGEWETVEPVTPIEPFWAALFEELQTSSMEYLTVGRQEKSRTDFSGLIETKIAIIRMLATCGLPSQDVAWLWALGSADSHHSVIHYAEMELKQAPGAGLNHPKPMRKLYEFYLGTATNQATPQSGRRGSADLRIKLKLMTYFLRYADLAASIFPQSVQVVFENWFGRETNERLRNLGTDFAASVIAKMTGQTAAVFAPIMFSKVKMLLDDTHDPKAGSSYYSILGKLGSIHSKYVLVGNKRVEMVQDLFDDLSEVQNDDICKTVQTCLFDWLDGFTKDEETNISTDMTLMEACILAYSEHKSPMCRLVALRFLDRLFPPDHAPSRFALLLASDDQDEKVRREAMGIIKKVDLDVDEVSDAGASFIEASQYFHQKISRILEKEEAHENSRTRLSAATLNQMIFYLHDRMIADHNRDRSESSMDEDGAISTDTGLQPEPDEIVASSYFGSSGITNWRPYFDILVIYFDKYGGNDEDMLTKLAEVIFGSAARILKEEIIPALTSVIPKLADATRNSTNDNLILRATEILARLYAIMKSRSDVENELQLDLQNIKTDAFLSPAKVYLQALLYAELNTESEKPPAIWTSFSQLLCERFRRSVSNWEMANLDVSTTGLMYLALKGALRDGFTGNDDRRIIYGTALDVIKSRKDIVTERHKERCVGFLGCWMTNEPQLNQWKDVVTEIMKSAAEGPPDLSVQPVIGKCLVAYCLSPVQCSPYGGTRDRYLRSNAQLKGQILDAMRGSKDAVQEAGIRIDWMLEYLLKGPDAEKAQKNKNYKQASCVWIEALLQYCGRCEALQRHFEQLQTFFISCLAETNDYTQDVAGRSLSMLFHCCQSQAQRSQLAKSMRDQLTATSAKPTLLPYQELCALCVVTCQRPELVYDLMLLALNRRPSGTPVQPAIRFPSLVASSMELLKPYERALVPAFFRFTYDPDPNVKRVFQNVWASVGEYNRMVTSKYNKRTAGQSLTEIYSNELFDHLLYCLESENSRYREASCIALHDFLSGSRIGPRALEKIGELWERGLRVSDDGKELVAVAGSKLVKALHKFTIRMCSPDGCPNTVIPIVVPRLLDYGLQYNAAVVKLTSLFTIMALVKETPPAVLKPYLAVIMTNLLDALSWTENQKINYLSVRADESQREQIDQARVDASKSSPIMDTLESCCRFVDDETLQSLVPKLIQMLQANVGLATKGGACRLVVILRAQAPLVVAPFADSLLKCLIRCLTDRNSTIRKKAATTIGQLAPLCSDPALDKLFTNIENWYLDIENPSMQVACAYALRSLASNASDVVKHFGSRVAPIAFLASQNEPTAAELSSDQVSSSEEMKAIWDEVLAEVTLSTHIWDVYNFCARLLSETPSWTMKALSAKTIGALASKMDANLNYEKCHEIMTLLVKSLDGRTWDGKEFVFISLGTLAEKFNRTLNREMGADEKASVAESLLRECQKKNKPKYRLHAVQQTAIIADALSLRVWDRLFDIVAPSLQLKKAEESEDEASDDEFRRLSYTALARCLSSDDVESCGEKVRSFGTLLLERLSNTIWKDQLAILDALKLIFDKNLSNGVVDSMDVMDVVLGVLDHAHQSVIKRNCIAVIRASFEDVIKYPAKLRSFKNSTTAERLVNHDILMNQARDLIERMKDVISKPMLQ